MDITGYILDSSLTGFVYDISTYGVVATFSVSGVSMDYVNSELEKRVPKLDASIINFAPVVFDNSAGNLGYDVDEGTLSFGLADGGSLQIGKETFEYFTNLSGVTLVSGDVVSIIGASGNRQAVTLTNVASPQIASAVIGMVTSGPVPPNEKVRVTLQGDVHQLDTDAFTEGWPVYVDEANPGKLTQTPPTAPNAFIHVGVVTVKNQNNGIITVGVRYVGRLEDLSDVDGTALTTNGQILVWDNDNGYWDANKNINDYATGSTLSTYVPSASLGTGFTFNSGTSKWDVSGGSGTGTGVSKAYVDGSLATLNASINNANFIQNASEGLTKVGNTVKLGGMAMSSIDIEAKSGLWIYNKETNPTAEFSMSPAGSDIELKTRNIYWPASYTSLHLEGLSNRAFLECIDNSANTGAYLGMWPNGQTTFKMYDTSLSYGLDIFTSPGQYAIPVMGILDSGWARFLFIEASILADAPIHYTTDFSDQFKDESLITKRYLNANSSLGFLWSITNPSLGRVSALTYALNASTSTYATNASVNIALASFLRSASLGSSFLWNAGVVDVSLAGGGVTQSYVDTADNLIKARYIPNSSLNQSTFKWTAGGYLEPSVAGSGGVSQSYVDGSLSTRDTAIDASFAAWKVYDDARWIDINRNGFINQTDTSLLFNDTTRVFTLAASTPGGTWKYIRAGIEYSKTGDTSVLIPDVSGTNYLFINNTTGTLEQATSVWTLLDYTLPVATLRWNPTSVPKYLLGEERHSSLIDRRMHYYLHSTVGAKYLSGGSLDGPTVLGTNSSDNCFGVAETKIADEDIINTCSVLNRPSNTDTSIYKISYRTASTTWRWASIQVPYLYTTAGYIQYDSNGSMTQASPNYYVNTYLLYTNEGGIGRFTLVPGRDQFSSAALAQSENPLDFSWTGFPIAEAVLAYQFTWETKAAYATLGKVKLAIAPKRINAGLAVNPNTGGTISHDTLGGLQGGTTNEYYHLTSAQYADFVGKTYVDGSISSALASNASLGLLTTKVNYIDASLGTNWSLTSALNASTSTYATNASVNSAFASNASLGLLTTKVNYIDASLGRTSVLTYALNASTLTYATNASVNTAFLTNASLGLLTTKVNYIDASLGTNWSLTSATNVSVGSMYSNARIDASFATNASVNAGFVNVIKNASLNQTTFKWVSGLLEPSVNGINIGLVVDGAGSAITTGSKGYREITGNYTIAGWTITANAAGSVVVDVKNSTYTTFPTTISIAGSEKPTLSTAQKNQDNALTTWTTSVSTGDILEFVVDSASTITKLWLFLKLIPR